MMRQLLIAAAVFIASAPAMAQWGGGDGSQAGATAWCAARAAGKSLPQANRAASNALVNSMGGSFTSNIATIITGGSTMRDSLEYSIRRQCPEYIPVATATKQDQAAIQQTDLSCIPWFEDCKDAKKAAGSQNASCNRLLAKYECSYRKYLSANSSIENWARLNPELAKKEAIKLGAIDADSMGANVAEPSLSAITTSPSLKEIESKCLKAADYKGCMEYHNK